MTGQPEPSVPAQTTSSPKSDLQSDQFFTELQSVLAANPDLVKSIKSSFLFQITVNKNIAGTCTYNYYTNIKLFLLFTLSG